MKQASSIFRVLLLSLGMVSCRSIYTPTTPNTPLFTDKKQFDVEGTFFTNGWNGKLAYSPVKHVALQVNGQHSRQLDLQNPEPHHHDYLEGAAGFYHAFKNLAVVEVYAGYGQGSSDYGSGIFSGETYIHRGKGWYEKTYLQLNVGSHRIIEDGTIGFSCRVANVRYSYNDCNFKWLTNTTQDHLSMEPYLFFTQKLNDRTSFVGNIGLTLIEGNTNEDFKGTIKTNFINVGLGIRFSLGKKGEVK